MEANGHIPVWIEQRVLRTNARGRHVYCERFKAWIVEQALRPGMSVAGLAMRNQVNANQLRRWVLLQRRREVESPQSHASRLLPVTVAEPPMRLATPLVVRGTPEVAVEIELSGALVRVREGASQQTLRQVTAALRGVASGVQS